MRKMTLFKLLMFLTVIFQGAAWAAPALPLKGRWLHLTSTTLGVTNDQIMDVNELEDLLALIGGGGAGLLGSDNEWTARNRFTHVPAATGLANAPFYVNPASAASNRILGAIAVNGTTRFSIDAEGDLLLLGDAYAYGSWTGSKFISEATTGFSYFGNKFNVNAANGDIHTSGALTLGTPLAIAYGGTGAASTSQNYVFAGPTSGSGAPAFRALVVGDIPSGVWTSSNDGAGSGLDADLLDGINSTGFGRLAVGQFWTAENGFLYEPIGAAPGSAGLYVNPPTNGGSNANCIFGGAVGGSTKFVFTAGGDFSITGNAIFPANGTPASGKVPTGTDGSGNWTWQTPAAGGVTDVTGTSPIASSGGATPAISIANAAADGSTKGAASFTAADFDHSSGNISLDYASGQKATGSVSGFLSSTDWTTFNSKQAGDADLSTYAGITPSANVQSLLAAANYSAMRTLLTLVPGTDIQAYDADLSTYAGITPSANVQTMLGSADNSAIRSNIGLAIGTNVQAYDADLSTYAGITPSANVQTLLGSANNAAAVTNLGLDNTKIDKITCQIGNGVNVPSTGVIGWVSIPYGCTINSVTMLADVSGSAVVDIWKDSYANYPPTIADTITASALPTISSATKSTDATLTGWTTSVSAGDVLKFNLNSVSTITKLVLVLKVTKT